MEQRKLPGEKAFEMGSEKGAAFQEAKMGVGRMWATAGLARQFLKWWFCFLPFSTFK